MAQKLLAKGGTGGGARNGMMATMKEHVPRYIPRNRSLGIFRGKVSLGIF
ncbi:hypothetical protein YC2023_075750 [Brassica napus]